MTDDKRFSEKQLDVLHDHYKETFARVRVTETQRDRLFLWSIAVYAVLAVEIGYPAATGDAIGTMALGGLTVQLNKLPLAALLNVSWVLALTLGLRYCQATIFVTRQYSYLHMLEEVISPLVGGGQLYTREGKAYLREYPLLLNFAWIAYGLLFPIIVLIATSFFIYWEITRVPYPFYHIAFDAVLAVTIGTVFVLYRIQPTIADRIRRGREKSKDVPVRQETVHETLPSKHKKR